MLQLKVSNQPRLLVFFLLFWWHLLFSLANADTFIPYGKPTIDGEFAAGEWPDLSHIRMARFYGFDQFADFWLQWDDTNLYIAGRLDDFTPHEEDAQRDPNHCHTWTDDSIEIYLHPSANLPANNGVLNELSRILAFTMTGLCQRLDRGDPAKYPQTAPTTGLEDFGNTTAVI